MDTALLPQLLAINRQQSTAISVVCSMLSTQRFCRVLLHAAAWQSVQMASWLTELDCSN
jgi:hypothetical protein